MNPQTNPNIIPQPVMPPKELKPTGLSAIPDKTISPPAVVTSAKARDKVYKMQKEIQKIDERRQQLTTKMY